jgi:adenylate cyclase
MVNVLGGWNEKRVAEGKLPVKIGVGLNTDSLVAGNIGSPKRMDFTMIGDGVNLASRLESACKQYGAQILVSESTFAKLRGTYRSRLVDNVVVKGKTRAVPIHEILDYHDEKSFPRLPEFLQIYRLAMDQYHARRFREAAATLGEALALRPDDKVCAIHVERCARYLEQPPPDDWDGAWELSEK